MAALACGGTLDGVRLLAPATIERAIAEQIYAQDLVLGFPIRWGLGFMLNSPTLPLSPNPRTFGHGGGGTSLLLMAAGVITTLPLVWFTAGARRIPLYVLGVCQYIAPSLQFLLAVWIYGEPFSGAQLTTFALVWSGLAVFVLAGLPLWGLARSSRRPG
jgi:drug/metabolite transporter (DMT)-like permease